MRTMLTTITLLAMASPSLAIESVTSTSLSCQAIHSVIKKNRSVLLHYSGAKGLSNYDRVVADTGQCSAGSGASQTVVFPASDTKGCPVLVCMDVSDRRP